jgi:hypothetical protein
MLLASEVFYVCSKSNKLVVFSIQIKVTDAHSSPSTLFFFSTLWDDFALT